MPIDLLNQVNQAFFLQGMVRIFSEVGLNKIIFLFLLLFSCFMSAQEMDVFLDFSLGTGAQAGVGGEKTEWNRSPLFFDLELMINTDNDPLFEAGVSLTVPVEDRLGFGIVPKAKIKRSLNDKWELYITGGIPLYFVGYQLYGVQAEPGVRYSPHHFLNFFVEGQFITYFYGDDIVDQGGEEGVLIQFNIACGASFRF